MIMSQLLLSRGQRLSPSDIFYPLSASLVGMVILGGTDCNRQLPIAIITDIGNLTLTISAEANNQEMANASWHHNVAC